MVKVVLWIVTSPFGKAPFPLAHSVSDSRKGAIDKIAREDWWGNKAASSTNKEDRDLVWKYLYRRGFRVHRMTITFEDGYIYNAEW